MQSEQENHQVSLPKTLGEILEQSNLQANLESTLAQNSKSLSTTGSQTENKNQIGKQLSEIGLNALRNLAQNVNKGLPLDDRELETLLAQHFGSSRFIVKHKVEPVYSKDGGYDEINKGYEIFLDCLHDCEMKLFDALDYFNAPAKTDFVAKQIARLRTVMARTNESNEDLAILIDTYATRLTKYPPDVIKTVCDKMLDSKKWFPTISDIVAECDRLVSFRRGILQAFERCRNPLLMKRSA